MEVVTNEEFINSLLQFIGGSKGLVGLGLVMAVVQLIIKLLKTPFFGSLFSKVSGNIKLCIVTGLTLVAGIISLKLSGLSLTESLLHSTTLAAFQVFFNQIYQHFFKKP